MFQLHRKIEQTFDYYATKFVSVCGLRVDYRIVPSQNGFHIGFFYGFPDPFDNFIIQEITLFSEVNDLKKDLRSRVQRNKEAWYSGNSS